MALDRSEADTWVRHSLVAGEEPVPDHGALRRDLASDEGEHWSLTDGPGPGIVAVVFAGAVT